MVNLKLGGVEEEYFRQHNTCNSISLHEPYVTKPLGGAHLLYAVLATSIHDFSTPDLQRFILEQRVAAQGLCFGEVPQPFTVTRSYSFTICGDFRAWKKQLKPKQYTFSFAASAICRLRLNCLPLLLYQEFLPDIF
jgi:hypothetical protein